MSTYARLRRNFEPYRQEVTAIAEQIADVGRDDLPKVRGYIASGGCSDVVRMSDPSLVVKIPYELEDRGITPRQVAREYVKAMVPGIGRHGLAQIVAYNDDRRRKPLAVVCGYVEGSSLDKLSQDAKSAIPPKDYIGVLATFEAMQGRLGIESDAAGNFVHNSSGFVVVDYELDPTQTLTEKVAGFGSALITGTYFHNPVPDYGLLYRDVCAEVLGGDTAMAIEDQWRRSGYERF